MCYEQWTQRKREAEVLEKAREETDKVIEKAKSAPHPRPETETRPEAESETV